MFDPWGLVELVWRIRMKRNAGQTMKSMREWR